MTAFISTNRRWFAAALLAAASIVVASQQCQAGIVGPAPISFGVEDLERELASKSSHGSATIPDRAHQLPMENEGDPTQGPSARLKPAAPVGSTSSSGSSSNVNSSGAGNALCVSEKNLADSDDSPSGRLTDPYGLFLPDPPGTDLLRPPRA